MTWFDREDTIFEQINKGVPAEDIYKNVRHVKSDMDHKKGANTEDLFKRHMFAFYGGIVTNVDKTNTEQDLKGVDYYVTFKSGEKLPVQVKSSETGVLEFKNDPRFIKDFGRKIIVINSASYVSKNNFKKAFSKELRRIRELDNG